MEPASDGLDPILDHVLSAMAGLIDDGDADVVQSEDGREIGVFGDVWTIHLEKISGALTAFAVVDDEPDDPLQIPQIRAAVFDTEIIGALKDLDTLLEGELIRALVASGDPLSVDLAGAME